MVSDKDRQHFAIIAAAEAEMAQAAILENACRTPSANIALGLELGELAAAFGADLTKPDPVPAAVLWQARTERRTSI
jgi:hypothetical protein